MRHIDTQPKIGIKDVANELGVSIMTVSRAMRGVEGVSEETRERVLRVAKTLGYEPNYNARSLAVAKSKLIGVSVPTLFDEVFAEILTVARSALERSGYDLIIETSSYDIPTESVWIDRILKWAPTGLILTGVDHAQKVQDRLRGGAIPVIEIWDYSETPIDVCVGIDHYEAGALAAEHMLQAGYRSACLVGISEAIDARAEKRFAGFSQAFQSAGKVTTSRVNAAPSFEAGHIAINEMTPSALKETDCFFFLNDHLAFGGLCALESKSISIPDDVGVIGFNDLGINNVLPKRVTSVATDRELIGSLAASQLLARINGAKIDNLTKVPVRIAHGDTTRRIGSTNHARQMD